MSDIAIRVENLGKRYRLGQMEPYRTLRDTIANVGKKFVHRFTRPQIQQDDPADLWALKDVSFEIKQGEVVGIIGRNGAGKSTLLKILSRITEPTTGRAELFGRVGSLLEVGTGFHPELTGRENIYLNGAILGMTRGEITRRFDEIVSFAEMEKFLDTPVKRYSSGMYTRLAFAVAAHLEPEILIVDEVLAVGDAEFQKKCLGKMSGVAKSGRTVLFVSHNMAAVEALCTSGVLLQDGAVLELGHLETVVPRYLRQACATAGYDMDLEKCSGRTTSGREILRRLRLISDGGLPLESLRVGMPVIFEVHLNSQVRISDIAIAIHICSSRGQRVVTLHTRYQYPATLSVVGNAVIQCHWARCDLTPGTYTIVLGVDVGRDRADRIESGIAFEVCPSDVYGTGRLPPDRDGVIVPDVVWHDRQRSLEGSR